MQLTSFKPYIFSILFLLLFITACERNRPHKENIASVNDAPITLAEFQKEVSLRAKRDPAYKITPQILEEQLNTVIDKKLLIQEAMEKGLSEDPQFAETIKTFWEQTLIRELVELKTKEWEDKLFVTENEIERHYQKAQYMPTIKLVKVKNKEQAEVIKEKMLKGLQIDGEETMGPLYLEDVKSEALVHAFDINVGEVKMYESEGEYIVMQVVKREKAAILPLKDVYSRIKTLLLEQKKQDTMEKWLKDVKGSAKIQINVQLLKGIANEPR